MSDRPIFTKEQLEQYFDYIGIPTEKQLVSGQANTSEGLKFLNLLIKHQICNVPFENLDLHYSTHHSVSLDDQHLFHKIVERKVGRGGYCMQNNSFFATVLRSLGYTLMSAGARVCDAVTRPYENPDTAPYTGFGHRVNIVYIEGKKYFTDVGFGSRGPTFAVPLEEGYTAQNTGDKNQTTMKMLLVRDHVSVNTHHDPEQVMWIYKTRFDDAKPYDPCYCFTETEFFPADFIVMNWYVSTHIKSMFTNKVLCQKSIMDDEGNIIGDITLFENIMKERRHGESKALCEIKCDQDRVDALEKYMGVILTKPERDGIRGYYSMIQDSRS